jgi:hypothetical protein
MDVSLYKEPRFFSSGYAGRQEALADSWDNYFSRYGRGKSMVIDRRKLRDCLWQGVADDQRGRIEIRSRC